MLQLIIIELMYLLALLIFVSLAIKEKRNNGDSYETCVMGALFFVCLMLCALFLYIFLF